MTGRLITLGEGLGVLRSRELGSLAHSPELVASTGGAEANVAIGVARLGGRSVWIGRVGDDGLGLRVARELRAEGVDARAILDAAAPTGLLLKESPSAGRTHISYYRAGSAGSRLAPADLDGIAGVDAGSALEWGAADILHVTGITPALSSTARAAVYHAMELARGAGMTISFDVNHRSRLWSAADATPIYRAIAARADIVFAGDDEARLLVPSGNDSGTGSGDPADHDARSLARQISELGPHEVIIKRGEHGATALVDGRLHAVPAVAIRVVDTVGAGDGFVAGYLTERLAGMDVDARLQTAALVGAIVCTHPGDWEGLPTRAALAAFGGTGDPVSR